jgi:hypothetical protein
LSSRASPLSIAERAALVFMGSVLLSHQATYANACVGQGTFADVGSAEIILTDKAGKDVGTARLASPTQENGAICDYEFSVSHLPQLDVYTISVGSYRSVSYPFQALNSDNWTVRIPLR